MMEERKVRDLARQRDDDAVWTDPNLLYVPEKLQKRLKVQGLGHRWLRIALGGEGGERYNLAVLRTREREGWKFLTAEEAPEWEGVPAMEYQGRGNLIVVGDLALAVMPLVRLEARNRAMDRRAENLLDSVRANLQNANGPVMTISDNSKSFQTVGKGRKPRFEEEDE